MGRNVRKWACQKWLKMLDYFGISAACARVRSLFRESRMVSMMTRPQRWVRGIKEPTAHCPPGLSGQQNVFA